MSKQRTAIGALVLSAAGLIGLVAHEGYTDKAVVPVPGDHWTMGYGSTFKEDGTPVKQGDTTTPQKALRMTMAHIAKDEKRLQQCVTGELSQKEYDILIDFSYWRGAAGTCRSDVVKYINQGNYVASCEAYLNLDSRKAAGKDCKQPGSGCRGVWVRAEKRYKDCMEAQ